MDLARLAAWRASGQLSHFLVAPTDNGGSSVVVAAAVGRLQQASPGAPPRAGAPPAGLLDHDDACERERLRGEAAQWRLGGGWCGARSGYEDDYEDIDGSVDDTAGQQ